MRRTLGYGSAYLEVVVPGTLRADDRIGLEPRARAVTPRAPFKARTAGRRG
ncbi:MAG: hypothetical protein ABIX12_11330 [Rubrivivax sp.]